MTIIRTIEGKPLDWFPGVYAESLGGGRIGVDPNGSLVTRGGVLTDEGGYRANFSGTSLFLDLGTCVFTNGSKVVTGANFDGEKIHHGDYVKLTADGDNKLKQIGAIVSDTELQLVEAYTGTSATGPGSVSIVNIKIGTGGSYSVGNSNLSVLSGTISGSVMEMERDVDYIPIIKQASLMFSQRTPNQTIVLGLYDDINITPQYWVWFKFEGTDDTFVTCESAFSRFTTPTTNEIEAVTVKLPNGFRTSQPLRYRIEALNDKVRFLINGFLVAELYKSIPNPYATLTSAFRITNNNTLGVSTTAYIDYDAVQNFNKLMMAPINDTDPPPATTNDLESLVNLLTQLISRTPLPDAFGRIRTAAEITASTVVTATNLSNNTAQWAGQTAATGLGASGNGAPRVTLSTDSLNTHYSGGASTSIGAQLPIIYNQITVS